MIPASTTYYFGDDLFLDGRVAPNRLEVVTQIGSEAKKSLALPPVANLRLSDYILGGVEIDGEVSNPFTRSLSGLALITGVIFDSSGNALGGGFTFPEASIPPGSRIGFAIGVWGAQLSQAASAQVSVEPEFAG